MAVSSEERERLTEVFHAQLAAYVPSKRPYHKRPNGAPLAVINRQHDAQLGSNPWFRLAIEGRHS